MYSMFSLLNNFSMHIINLIFLNFPSGSTFVLISGGIELAQFHM